jgi:hypothetical protein
LSAEDERQKWSQQLGEQVLSYCEQYAIPIQDFMEILRDQKVVPMLRGKGMEYNALYAIRDSLNPAAWAVRKLNLNPQPGTPDQDIEITHRRTGERFIAESKSACRGSMTAGTRAKLHKTPHFKVKCHRSRSNTAAAMNDRYSADSFDVLVTNPSNALFKGGTIGEAFEVVEDPALIRVLFAMYGVTSNEELIQATLKDWRFVFPPVIAEQGYIPRTPVVYLTDDPNWRSMDRLESQLEQAVRQRQEQRRRSRS